MDITTTKKATIRNALRKLWLQSKERNLALKNANYTCQSCGVKQSKAIGQEQKVQVHHKEGVGNWDKIIEMIQEELLCDPELLEVLCPDCHRGKTYGT
jgi:predicted HNH restriction endonuclease